MVNYQVFISYKSGPDKNIAENIYNELTKEGYIVFWDQLGIGRGEPYDEVIEKAINTSKLFVLLLSPRIIEAQREAMNNGREGPYIVKEVSFALKWGKTIYPFIIDGNNDPNDYEQVFPGLRINLPPKTPTEQIPGVICAKMDDLQIHPSNQERHKQNAVIENGLKSIKPTVRSIIDECGNCPRFSSKELGIQCPFIYSLAQEDTSLYSAESIRRTKENLDNYSIPAPIHPDAEGYVEHAMGDLSPYETWEEEMRYWEETKIRDCEVFPDDVRFEYESKYGAEHSCVSKFKPCGIQHNRSIDLELAAGLFSKPIFQQNLIELESDIIDIENELTDDVSISVVRSFGLYSYFRFVKQQLSWKWGLKRDIFETLQREEGFTSAYELLLVKLEDAITALKAVIDEHASFSIKNHNSFIIIWWILRKNSCFLTQNCLSDLESNQNAILLSKFKEFFALYDSIKSLHPLLLVESAVPLSILDFPEEDFSSPMYDILGYAISTYQWHTLVDWKMPLGVEAYDNEAQEFFDCSVVYQTELDACHNPTPQEAPYGLCRGISNRAQRELQSKESLKTIWAINYLYPIIQCCMAFVQHLADAKTLKNEWVKETKNNDFTYFNYEKPSDDSNAFDYHALLSPASSTGEAFDNAVRILYEGRTKDGLKMMRSLQERRDLEAMVYLADYYAYNRKKDYQKAIDLFERAAENGIEFCFSRLAECYEHIGNYRQACRWYMVADGLKTKKELKLRLGVCCYHLNMLQTSIDFFNKAGDDGQAARFILGLYGSDLGGKQYSGNPYYKAEIDSDDTPSRDRKQQEDYQQLVAALKTKVKKADELLGSFHRIHYVDYYRQNGQPAYSVERDIDVDSLTERARENDSDSQYLLGVLQMEKHIASDDFMKNALSWVRMAANNGNPEALCLLGRYLQTFREGSDDGEQLLEKALRVLYPAPFPELFKQ